jgi:hypothetical protein
LSQTTKTPCFYYYLLCFFFYKIREQDNATGSAQRWGRGGDAMGEGRREEVVQIIYTHVSKCKNDTC